MTIPLTTKNLTLCPIQPHHIPSYHRWTTTETEWQNWDAPWETEDWQDFVTRQEKNIGQPRKIHYKLEIETRIRGQHIGWVSSYNIDGDPTKLAVGIDIPPLAARGKGYGREALTAFIHYLWDATGLETIYTQTWSGNTPMLALAAKMGFEEIQRIKNKREVNGKPYDALTFAITPRRLP